MCLLIGCMSLFVCFFVRVYVFVSWLVCSIVPCCVASLFVCVKMCLCVCLFGWLLVCVLGGLFVCLLVCTCSFIRSFVRWYVLSCAAVFICVRVSACVSSLCVQFFGCPHVSLLFMCLFVHVCLVHLYV